MNSSVLYITLLAKADTFTAHATVQRLTGIHFIFGFTAATPRSMFHVELMRIRE